MGVSVGLLKLRTLAGGENGLAFCVKKKERGVVGRDSAKERRDRDVVAAAATG